MKNRQLNLSYFSRKVELLAGDGVRIMRRFDQCFNARQERPVLRRNVAAEGGDRAAYVNTVRIVRSRMRMAGMIEIVKQRRNQQIADLPLGKTVTIEFGRLVAQPGHMQHVA